MSYIIQLLAAVLMGRQLMTPQSKPTVLPTPPGYIEICLPNQPCADCANINGKNICWSK